MSESLSSTLLQSMVDLPCPACGFVLEIELVDVVCQVSRWCPCCRRRIQLIEAGGEMSGALAGIDLAMGDLEATLRGVFR